MAHSNVGELKSLVGKIYDDVEDDVNDDMDDNVNDSVDDMDDSVDSDVDDNVNNDTNTSALPNGVYNDMNQFMLLNDEEDDDDMALRPEQLEKLGSSSLLMLIAKSEKIKEFLRDDKLREIIYHINFTSRSDNVEDLLDATRKNDEIFFNFTEEILST
ncbi:10139_t:CDS:2, partial [Racocetra fulgida]